MCMKSLQEIKKELTEDIDANLEILKNYLQMPFKTKNDIVIYSNSFNIRIFLIPY